MKVTEKFIERIADAFPRAKDSAGVKRNWIYNAHVEVASAMSGRIAKPRKFQQGVKNGIFVEKEPGEAEFLAMPFLSDIAYMLASDTILRVDRAKRCVEDAWKELGEHGLCLYLERAWYSIPPAMALLSPDMPEQHMAITALIGAYAAAVAFAKMHMAELSGRGVPFAWGPNGIYYFLDGVDADDTPSSIRELSILCAAQRCNTLSYFSMTGHIDPKDNNFPGVLIDPNRLFLDAWGPGWLVWQLLDVGKLYGSGLSKRPADALQKAYSLFPLSYELSQIVARDFMAAMPEVKESSFDMRNDILQSQKYALWPGVTDVEWKEAAMSGLSLLPAKNGHIFAVVRGVVDLSQTRVDWPDGANVQLALDIPSFRDDEEWNLIRDLSASDDGPAGAFDELAIPMTAIRMCCVPVERKAQGNRVPGGYVQPPKTTKKTPGQVSVTYVPRVIRAPSEAPAPRQDGKRNIGVVGRHPRLHQVAGHIRQLAMEQSASNEARANASEAGFELPLNGFTYVRPHTRGIGEGETPSRKVRIKREDG